MLKTIALHIEGKVQGVGFRPHVYRQATEAGLTGWVLNGPQGVKIELSGEAEKLEAAIGFILNKAPDISEIHQVRREEKSFVPFEDFSIRESDSKETPRLVLTPDLDVCKDCLAEMSDPENRRYQYPFISCTQCGPRYSLITSLPYDRHTTTMAPWQQCRSCLQEYEDPLHRRFFSQTNSCHECGINLWLTDREGESLEDENAAIQAGAKALKEGEIVAVLGIGGFLLMADATSEQAVMALRKRKHRKAKPLAILVKDMEMVRKFAHASEKETAVLVGRVKPIVLLAFKQESEIDLALDALVPGLDKVGVMLPSAPLLHLLAEAADRPLVATSGNFSGAPIGFDLANCHQYLGSVADKFLLHDRPIAMPQDDSVWQISSSSQTPILLRRGRGIAPGITHKKIFDHAQSSILAMGGQLKSSFSLLHQQHMYTSQYLGKLEDYRTEERFRYVLNHFLGLFRTTPQEVITDLHPEYASTKLGKALANEWGVPLIQIQHHEAHFAAILGEHEMMDTQAPVLGGIWDGTGLGHDHQVWGSEMLLYANREIRRVAHLQEVPHFLGEKMAMEPRVAALAFLGNSPESLEGIQSMFSEMEWTFYQKLLRQPTKRQTSSMGRLFDAVAAVLGICDVQTYEGEAAMKLERLARKGWQEHSHLSAFEEFEPFGLVLNPSSLLLHVQQGLLNGTSKEILAARFHLSLVQWIQHVAEYHEVRKIAFSGGVFQNALLVDMCHHVLSEQFDLLMHQELSSNDESLSFGQVVHHLSLISSSDSVSYIRKTI
ncbi:MAG: carbamoyltransferase HypF [Bacteroidota bacterium]